MTGASGFVKVRERLPISPDARAACSEEARQNLPEPREGTQPVSAGYRTSAFTWEQLSPDTWEPSACGTWS